MSGALVRLRATFRPDAGGDWRPLLPLPCAPDVIEARRVISRGDIGALRQLHVHTYFGEFGSMPWDPPVTAADPIEAAAWGIDLAEALIGATIAATNWLTPLTGDGALALHTVGSTPVVHALLPAGVGPLTPFEARVTGAAGTIWLRAPFANGSPLIHRGQSFVMPLVAEARTPFLEADSYPGGLEMWRFELDAGSTDQPDADRARARRIAAHIQTSSEVCDDH